jgi:hypothetical protein
MNERSSSAVVPAALAGYGSFLAVDFLLHAVFLASWWRLTEAYWLPPEQLFQRIPFGYASFALYVAVLVWLLRRLHGIRPALPTAALFGLRAGVISGLGWALANYSVFAMPPSALLVWTLSLALESVTAATVVAWVSAGSRPWRRTSLVLGVAVLLLVVGVVIQSVWLPTPASNIAN